MKYPTTVISVFTSVCNYYCRFCSQCLPNKRMFNWSYEEITERLDELWNNSLINNIGGCGEVTVLPFFERLMDYFDTKPGRVCFSTNGYAINPESLRRRKLYDIAVSLHSITPDTYDSLTGTKGRLPRVLDNLAKLAVRPRDFKVIIVSVVTEANYREAPKLAQLAISLGVDELRFLPLCDPKVVGLEEYSDELILKDPVSAMDLIKKAGMAVKANNQESREILSPEAVASLVAENMKICLHPTNQIVIGLGGNVQPCCYIPDWIGLGNVLDTPWKEVWEGEKYNQFRKEVAAGTSEWCLKYCRNWG